MELTNEGSLASASGASTQNTAASVVLIGMRGSGKSFIGKLAASVLNWSFIDADHYLEEKLQISVREFVRQHGWPAFRVAESEILEELLASNPTKHVISLGGGIVETASARNLLKEWTKKGYVVHIAREIDEVLKYLGEETARPAYGEPIIDVFRRREPWFLECCNFEFVNYTGETPVEPSTNMYRSQRLGPLLRMRSRVSSNISQTKSQILLQILLPKYDRTSCPLHTLTSPLPSRISRSSLSASMLSNCVSTCFDHRKT